MEHNVQLELNPAQVERRKKKLLKVSAIARAQWKTLCPLSAMKSINNREIDYKILRAIKLGKTTHKYNGGAKLTRYWCLNVLHDGQEVLAIWKHLPKPVCIKTSTKNNYDKRYKAKYMAGSFPKGTNPPIEMPQIPLTLEGDV